MLGLQNGWTWLSRWKRASEDQQVEMIEMRRMIEDLSRALQALHGQERLRAHMGIPEGNHNPLGR